MVRTKYGGSRGEQSHIGVEGGGHCQGHEDREESNDGAVGGEVRGDNDGEIYNRHK